MPCKKDDLLYTDYKWKAKDDHDDPKFIHHPDSDELNRTEGYEMLYFINHCAKKWGWADNSIGGYRKLEKTIRTKVPSPPRTHDGIRIWIETNYKSFWDNI